MDEKLFDKFYTGYRGLCTKLGVPANQIATREYVRECFQEMFGGYVDICHEQVVELLNTEARKFINEYVAVLEQSQQFAPYIDFIRGELIKTYTGHGSEAPNPVYATVSAIEANLIFILNSGRAPEFLAAAIRDLKELKNALDEVVRPGLPLTTGLTEDELDVIIQQRMLAAVLPGLEAELQARQQASPTVVGSPLLDNAVKFQDVMLQHMCENVEAVLAAASSSEKTAILSEPDKEEPPDPTPQTTELEGYVRQKYLKAIRDFKKQVVGEGLIAAIKLTATPVLKTIKKFLGRIDEEATRERDGHADYPTLFFFLKSLKAVTKEVLKPDCDIIKVKNLVLNLLNSKTAVMLSLSGFLDTEKRKTFETAFDSLAKQLEELNQLIIRCIAANKTIIAFDAGVKTKELFDELQKILAADTNLKPSELSQLTSELSPSKKPTRSVFSSLRRALTGYSVEEQFATTRLTQQQLFERNLTDSQDAKDADYAKTVLLALISLADAYENDNPYTFASIPHAFGIATFNRELLGRMKATFFDLLGQVGFKKTADPMLFSPKPTAALASRPSGVDATKNKNKNKNKNKKDTEESTTTTAPTPKRRISWLPRRGSTKR